MYTEFSAFLRDFCADLAWNYVLKMYLANEVQYHYNYTPGNHPAPQCTHPTYTLHSEIYISKKLIMTTQTHYAMIQAH